LDQLGLDRRRPRIDSEFPESLVFRRTFDGGYVLEAAMFLADSEHDMSNLPDDIA
jgi:hypothetical protein